MTGCQRVIDPWCYNVKDQVSVSTDVDGEVLAIYKSYFIIQFAHSDQKSSDHVSEPNCFSFQILTNILFNKIFKELSTHGVQGDNSGVHQNIQLQPSNCLY